MKLAIAALAASLVVTAPALAAGEPWGYIADGQGNDAIFVAYQGGGENDAFEFGIDCTADIGDYSIYLITDRTWDDATSYADKVPVTITVDGVAHTGPSFAFEPNGDGSVVVAAYDTDDFDGVHTLIDAVEAAKDTIVVSYFDTTVSFDASGAADAIGQVHKACD
jgi:hypothetical protein